MRKFTFLLLPCLAATAAAQFPVLPSLPLTLGSAPRAAWSSVTSAGTTATGSTFRCDNPGAASSSTLYVFGGCLDNNTATTLNDLWALDAVAGTFTQLHDGVVSLAPHARGRAAVAWNATTNRLVVFGGDNRASGPLPANTILNDTWEYDPSTNTWTDVTPVSGSPSPRRWAGMAWDPITGGMLLFGGDTGTAVLSDTWLLLGGSWLPMGPAHVPPARRMAGLVARTNPEFHDVLLCGGEDYTLTGPYGADLYRHLDVWTWNGSDWTKLSDWDWANQTGSFPAGAIANQAVYDPIRRRVVIQGGQGIAANTATNTTYLFGTTTYNGSPTNYTSEFDCLTNSWTLYANPTTGTAPYNNTDPVLGRVSRYFAGFVAATGKIYKCGGQDPTKSGSRPTYNAYEYQATVLGTATAYGTGCTGPGGVLTLTADNEPWTGRAWSGTCTNLGPTSLAMTLWGTSTAAVPLNLILPFAGVGCDLLNTAELIAGPAIPAAGIVQTGLGIPNDIALAGLQLHTQVADLQFNGLGQWVGLFSSNGVTLTIGAL